MALPAATLEETVRFVGRKHRFAVLTHGSLGIFTSKTATCLARHRHDEVVCFVDREAARAGRPASAFIGKPGDGKPVVATIEEALRAKPTALVIGIAPVGGALPPDWRSDIETALRAKVPVVSGLHFLLGDDPALAALARENGVGLYDLRRPPAELRVADGSGRKVRALVIATTGTDCSVGKMTVSKLLDEEFKRLGLRSAFLATGQTGILVGAEAGLAADRVISDFVAGEIERRVVELDRQGFDVIHVEGQACLSHPGYSGVTLSILHGAFPDLVVLCHDPLRKNLKFPNPEGVSFPVPDPASEMRRVEALLAPISGGRVEAVCLAAPTLSDQAYRAVKEEVALSTGLFTVDVVREGVRGLTEILLGVASMSPKFARLASLQLATRGRTAAAGASSLD